ncbi:MAG TPA: TauD/TfdA family dioxygenase [Caulobacteraceae bacterium]|nr:TauD/TfdA family dioxygenase [Caulobacteraceae bacterium]
MGLKVTKSSDACGATVEGVDLTAPISADLAGELRAVWLEHQVLAFPDQPLDDDGLERFSLSFGPFGEDPFIAPIPGREHVLEVRREADETAPIFAETWHSDWSFLERPPSASILHGRVIPPVGGDTLFANQYAAYEALTDDLKAAIEGRKAVHSAGRAYGPDGIYGNRDVGRSMDIRPSKAALASRTHPMVRAHPETGRKALFFSPGYTIGIEGMGEEDGWALLLKLFRHQAQPQFVHRQSWAANMLVMWDNRCLNHMATGGYQGHQRVLHRTTVAG